MEINPSQNHSVADKKEVRKNLNQKKAELQEDFQNVFLRLPIYGKKIDRLCGS